MKILLILSLSLSISSVFAVESAKSIKEKQEREHLSLGILSIFCPVCGLGAVMTDISDKPKNIKKPLKRIDKLPSVKIKRELASIPE